MLSGPSGVQARVAEIQARLAGLSAGPGHRGGGVVGQGMQRALEGATAAGAAAAGAAPSVAPPAAPIAPSAPSAPVAPATPTAAPARSGPAAAGGGATPGWEQRLPEAGRAVAPLVTEAAARHGLRPELLAALVWSESGFRQEARSPAGAIGLGQLMPGTAAGLGVDPHDPQQNLDGAARYLRQQLDRFGDTRLALAAYNAGPGAVADAGGVPNFAETTAYVARVTERARMLGAA